MTDRLLLQGRYFSKLRKLGLMGVSTAALAGVAGFYGFYIRREKLYNDYEKTLTAENQKKTDERIFALAGKTRNEKYPHLNFLPKKDLTTAEARIDQIMKVPQWILMMLEARAINQYFGRDALTVWVKYYLDVSDERGFIHDEREREEIKKEFTAIREKFHSTFRRKYSKDVVQFAEWLENQPWNEKKAVFENFPKMPSEGEAKRNYSNLFKGGAVLPKAEELLYYMKTYKEPGSGPLLYQCEDKERTRKMVAAIWEVAGEDFNRCLENLKRGDKASLKKERDTFNAVLESRKVQIQALEKDF